MKIHLDIEYFEREKLPLANEAEGLPSSPCSFLPATACRKFIKLTDDPALEWVTKSVGCIGLARNLVPINTQLYNLYYSKTLQIAAALMLKIET